MNCGDKSVSPSVYNLCFRGDLAEKVNYFSEVFKFTLFFFLYIYIIFNILWSFKLSEAEYIFEQSFYY